ncbi:MAG: hypothetical protein AAF431_17245 [Pseudomonadota bacterium]
MKFKSIRIVVPALLVLALSACAQYQSVNEPEATSDAQLSLAKKAGAPLFDGMGDHHHPISTSDPNAQRYFDQGLVIDFAF